MADAGELCLVKFKTVFKIYVGFICKEIAYLANCIVKLYQKKCFILLFENKVHILKSVFKFYETLKF